MIQGLQGGQDVLIVPHMVHKVIWGRGKQKSGVIGGFCPCPWALPPTPPCVPDCLSLDPSPAITPHSWSPEQGTYHIAPWCPHGCRENKGDGDSEASLPCLPNPHSMHSLMQLVKHLLCLLSSCYALAPQPHFTGETAAGKWHYPLLRTKQASMSAPV